MLLACLTLLALTGCYPDLDWRELQSREGGFAVMFPARPREVTRELELGGTKLRMHMLSTETGGMAFGVGYAEIPNGIDGNVLIAATRDGLVRNIGGRVFDERAVTPDGLIGQEFHAEGTADERPMRMSARILVGHNRLYQVLFVGPQEAAETVDLPFYLESFRSLSPE